MSVLSDKWIRKMSKDYEMISPFEEKQIRGRRQTNNETST